MQKAEKIKFFEIFYRLGKKRGTIIIEATNKLEAMKSFQNMELGIRIKIAEIDEPLKLKIQKKIDKLRSPIKNRSVDIVAYVGVLEQLSVMLNAGMPINVCLNETLKSTQDPMLKAILEDITQNVESGMSLTKALTPYAKQLGNLSISMFDLGEQSGTLDSSINKLADILQAVHDNKMKLKKALKYPKFIMIAMAIAFSVVISFVVPQFKSLFDSMGTELPLPTLLLLWLEYALSNYAPYIIVGIVIFVIVFKKVYSSNEAFALKYDQYFLKTYLFGAVTRLSMLGRFVYIFDILVSAGIPIVDALKAAVGVVENKYMKVRLNEIADAINDGRSLYEGFEKSGFFESMILQMLKAGEESGALNKMLDKITKYYNTKYNDMLENVTTMIEPILTAMISIFVLLLALGIFLPMWTMAETMG